MNDNNKHNLIFNMGLPEINTENVKSPERQVMFDNPIYTTINDVLVSSLNLSQNYSDYIAWIPSNEYFNPGTIVKSQYVIQEKLYSSLFGATYKCSDIKNQKSVVIKFNNKSNIKKSMSTTGNDVLEDVQQEIEILQYFTKQNQNWVVKLLDTFDVSPNEILIRKNTVAPSSVTSVDLKYDDERYQYLCLVLEYVQYGDLYDFLVKYSSILSNEQRKDIFKQICKAVQYIHDNNIAHCDISAENILVYSDDSKTHGKDKIYKIKIADFGLALKRNNPDNTDWIVIRKDIARGKKGYLSFEAATSSFYQPFKNDIHSLGVILYLLFNNSFPYNAINDPWFITWHTGKVKSIYNDPRYWSFFKNVSLPMVNLICNMLCPEKNRYSISQILESIELSCI
jgi:serine/threonine protein kinase